MATLDGMVNVQIQPQVGGYMIRQDYKEGTVVRKGQVLFEIDPRPWQAIQDQATGSLDQARAQYKLATINVARDTPLVEAQAYPQSSLDTELGTQEADKALVESAEATLESAKLNVGFTKVRSLIDGVVGQAAIQAGNLVSTTSQLVEVSQLNPVRGTPASTEATGELKMSKFFIGRPIVSMVIAILMVIGGVVCILSLPTAQFPDIVPPEILVQAMYPGADAKTLEQSVVTPIDQQVNGVDNMNYMYSTSASNGLAQLTVDFNVKTKPDNDQILTELRVSQAQSQLPAEVQLGGITVQKSLSSPLMLLSVSSPKSKFDSVFLASYAYINMIDQLTRVRGVSRVQVFGAGNTHCASG